MKEELASHTAEHIRNIIQGCLETLVEEARKEVLEDVMKFIKKKREDYDLSSTIAEWILDDLENLIKSLI